MKTASELAKHLELDNHSDFDCFEYMLLSYNNGQTKQMINLFNQLDIGSKEKFVWYLHNENKISALKTLTINLI